jgi:hypothetical protein
MKDNFDLKHQLKFYPSMLAKSRLLNSRQLF